MPFVVLDELAVHYRDDGTGPTTVVFANSLGTDLRIWDDVVSDARSTIRSLRYDKRGHGLTEATPPPYTVEVLAGDLLRLMDAREVDRAVLCGVSIGGLIALEAAATHPGRVRALILCDTAAKIGDAELWNGRIEAVRTGGLGAIADGVTERWFTANFRDRRTAEHRGWQTLLLRTSVDGYTGACAAIRDADLRERAAAIPFPALVICGSEDGATPPDLVRDFARTMPAARFELIERAGHLPCIEQPEAVVKLMHEFLGEHGLV